MFRGYVFPFVAQVGMGVHQYPRHMDISNVVGVSNKLLLLTFDCNTPRHRFQLMVHMF